jgi:aryl-alcohol dehydrogenase-like predicted oxidoreductase
VVRTPYHSALFAIETGAIRPMTTDKPLISGWATPEGTARFAEQAVEKALAPQSHFRRASTGQVLSSMGLGTYLGEQDAETNQNLEQAVISGIEAGAINVLDTAINYRSQLSERCIGRALLTLLEEGALERDEIFVATKNGYLTPDADDPRDFMTYFREEYLDSEVVIPEEIANGSHCMTPAFLDNQLERSRQNLGLATIDLMYLHNAAESQMHLLGYDQFMMDLREAFAYFEDARAAGAIRYYGMATWDCFLQTPEKSSHFLSLEAVSQLAHDVAGDDHGFRYIQLPYNFGLLEALNNQNQTVAGKRMSVLHAAQALGMNVFTSVPLMQGQLLDFDLPAMPHINSKAQACIQFVRSTPGILAPLIGQKSPEHVSENLALAQLDPIDWAQFQELFSVRA